jgi:hypothetical protein
MKHDSTLDAIFHQVMGEIEQSAQSKLKEFQVVGETGHTIVFFAIFENEKQMAGHMTLEELDGRFAVRIQGNFV